MILRLDVPHLRRGDDAVHLVVERGSVSVISPLPTDQLADVLTVIADALATGAYTVTQPGGAT